MLTAKIPLLHFTPQAPGVWRLRVGAPEGPTPLGLVGARTKIDALDALSAASMPYAVDQIEAERVGSRLVVRLPLQKDEALHGLGLQFHRVEHRGRTRYLRVNSDPKEDTGETHAPVALVVSSRGYAVLADTARIVTIHCGSTEMRSRSVLHRGRDRNTDSGWEATPTSDIIEIVLGAPGVDILFFGGSTPLEAVQRYNLYCGGGTLPPRWGLGFWHRVASSATDEDAIATALEFRRRDYPCDVIGLEPGWHTKAYPTTFDWNLGQFPDPAEFVARMRSAGLRVNLWENPYVSVDATVYPKLQPYSGSHTVWGGLAVDYTIPAARAALQEQHERAHVAIGISGYKIDEVDGSELTGSSWMFPAHATFPSGCDGEELRQVFGLLLQKTTAEIFHRRDTRTYGLVRASSAGASSLPYALYSDLYDHRQWVRALVNSSFSGLLWCPEVRTADSAEEWVRRMHVVCFSPPAMLNAWASSTMQWSYADVAPIVQHYLTLRMRLMPYFYSAFSSYHFEGIPPFRAMALETGRSDGRTSMPDRPVDLTIDAYGHPAPDAIDDQYMAGDALLIAPLFAGETKRSVCLPPGGWFEFETDRRHEGGQTLEVIADLAHLPIFVREGAIIPTGPSLMHAPSRGEAIDLEVQHYGKTPGKILPLR